MFVLVDPILTPTTGAVATQFSLSTEAGISPDGHTSEIANRVIAMRLTSTLVKPDGGACRVKHGIGREPSGPSDLAGRLCLLLCLFLLR